MSKLRNVQWLLAEMASRIEACRWLTYKTAALYDEGKNIVKESAISKLLRSSDSR
jgi:alkylation response protein AidB-like acyl-CoA dehydrogenase